MNLGNIHGSQNLNVKKVKGDLFPNRNQAHSAADSAKEAFCARVKKRASIIKTTTLK